MFETNKSFAFIWVNKLKIFPSGFKIAMNSRKGLGVLAAFVNCGQYILEQPERRKIYFGSQFRGYHSLWWRRSDGVDPFISWQQETEKQNIGSSQSKTGCPWT